MKIIFLTFLAAVFPIIVFLLSLYLTKKRIFLKKASVFGSVLYFSFLNYIFLVSVTISIFVVYYYVGGHIHSRDDLGWWVLGLLGICFGTFPIETIILTLISFVFIKRWVASVSSLNHSLGN